ncbi:MAG: hypothetical protein AAF108_04690 [Planctomycetota bacterium]
MDTDIDPILDTWPHEPGKLNVRMIQTSDGDQRLQIRLDLGLLQMHVDGRPDGTRPDGFESLLEVFEARVDAGVGRGDHPPDRELDAEADREMGPEPGGALGGEADAELGPPEFGGDAERQPETTFSPEECQALRDEAVQYYHRYLSLLALEEYERVIRDTTRNLRVADLVRRHGETEQERASMEPFRVSITMMRARALASLAMRDSETKAALHALDEGLEALHQHFERQGEIEQYDDATEVQMLRSMREALLPKLPVSQKAELTERLERALEQENYRLAAILRDELELIERRGKPQ